MRTPKLTPLELQIMEALWDQGTASIREIQQAFPEKNRPAYTTVQTTMYRLEGKKVLRRIKKISNAHIFEAVLARDAVHHRLVDDLIGFFRGGSRPLMAHLIKTGRLTLDDVKDAERTLRKLDKDARSARKDKS